MIVLFQTFDKYILIFKNNKHSQIIHSTLNNKRSNTQKRFVEFLTFQFLYCSIYLIFIPEHYMDKYAQYSKPNFTLRLRDILIVEGSAARLDCKISGLPDPDIRWFKDHKEIEDGQHYSIEYEDDETCTLIIQEAFLVDAGTYTCQASNLLGRISCDAVVRVEREYCLV